MWTRSDDDHGLNVALEACGGKHFPGPPHSPNSNIVERVFLTFGDLQRMTFAQSGCPPFWRPVIAISAAQQWAIHRQTVRRDIDGKEISRTPMLCRHTDSYRPVGRSSEARYSCTC